MSLKGPLRTLSSIESPRGLGGLTSLLIAAGSVLSAAATCGLCRCGPAACRRRPNGSKFSGFPRAPLSGRAAGPRTADYSTCCSNETGSATCTRNESTPNGAKPSSIHPRTALARSANALGIHLPWHRHRQRRVRVLAGRVHRRNLAAGSHKGSAAALTQGWSLVSHSDFRGGVPFHAPARRAALPIEASSIADPRARLSAAMYASFTRLRNE